MSFKDLKFQLVKKSSNQKTGRIAISNSSRQTCPKTCPLLENGCYASEGYYTRLNWDKVTSGERGVNPGEFFEQLESLPRGYKFRHNVSGDLPSNDGKISRTFLRRLTAAVKHLQAFTYTHHLPFIGENAEILRTANASGFTVNLSTQSEKAADIAIETYKLPAVMAVKSTEKRQTWRTAAGNRVLVCPAQTQESKTCADCMLCRDRPKNLIIAFRAHGSGRNKADLAIGSEL